MITNATPDYAAFISYAHADEAMAARLHKALETYAVPKHLRSEGRTTRPIFRDLAELTAAHSLSEKIRDAVNNSQVLIVLCSPAAKASHWVNEEIKLFREIHGEGAIFSALIEGTPATSFPEALIQDGREPLAASLGASKTGFRLGVTQLAAGMLGTGLDELVQRGAKRRSQRMGVGLAASLAFSAVMGFTAFQAVDARNEAELERGESEALLEYMVKDLKVKLEPAGSLDLLEGVGRKAIEYYEKKNIDTLSDDNLTTFAAARQVIAQVALDADRMQEAQKEIEASSDLTREVLARNPDDTDAIFAHAQSEYWVGENYKKQGKNSESEMPWREYDRLAQILYKKDPKNFNWIMEAGWGQNNLGFWARESLSVELLDDALQYYDNAINYFEEALKVQPESDTTLIELAGSLSGRSFVELSTNTASSAREFKERELSIRASLETKYPNSIPLKFERVKTLMDYYDRFYLFHSENQKMEVVETLRHFFELAKHDVDNFTDMQYFLNASVNDFEKLDKGELKERKYQITYILDLYKKSDPLDFEFFLIMTDIISARIYFLEEAEFPMAETLKSIRKKISDADMSDTSFNKIYYAAFLRFRDAGLKIQANKYASEFLALTEVLIKDIKDPRISKRKIVAYSELGMCDKINPLAKDLVTRGFAPEEWQNSIQCS